MREEPGTYERDIEHALQVLCAFIRCGKDGDLPPTVLMVEADLAIRALTRITADFQDSRNPSE
jgi:hypothetical protein